MGKPRPGMDCAEDADGHLKQQGACQAAFTYGGSWQEDGSGARIIEQIRHGNRFRVQIIPAAQRALLRISFLYIGTVKDAS